MALKHGVFLPQFHNLDENPTGAIHRDLELMEHLDRLGFHEAWIGEHHSAGMEIVSSPDRSRRFVDGSIRRPADASGTAFTQTAIFMRGRL